MDCKGLRKCSFRNTLDETEHLLVAENLPRYVKCIHFLHDCIQTAKERAAHSRHRDVHWSVGSQSSLSDCQRMSRSPTNSLTSVYWSFHCLHSVRRKWPLLRQCKVPLLGPYPCKGAVGISPGYGSVPFTRLHENCIVISAIERTKSYQ
jgi:hypothetical protein